MKKLRTKLLASVLVLALILQFFPVRAFANDDQNAVPAEEPGVVQEVEAEVPEEEETALPEQPAEEAEAPEEEISEDVQEEPVEEPEELPEDEPDEQPAEEPEPALPETSSVSGKQAGTKGDKDPAVTENFEVWAELETYSNADKNINFTYNGQPHTWGGDQSYSIHFYKESEKTPMTEISLAEVQALGFTVSVSARHMDGTVDTDFGVTSTDAMLYDGGASSPFGLPKGYRPYFDVIVSIDGNVNGYIADGPAEGRVDLVIDPAPVTVKVVGRTETITYDGKSHDPKFLYDLQVLSDPTGMFNASFLSYNDGAMVKPRSTYAGEYTTGLSLEELEKGMTVNNGNFTVKFDSAEYGTLTVNPAPLTVRTGSARVATDGTDTQELTCDKCEISGICGGIGGRLDDVSVKATGRQIGVGSSVNTYDLSFGNDNLAKSYIVTEEDLGTLTIAGENEVLITVDVKADSQVIYNGQEQVLTATPDDFNFHVDNPRYSLDNISVAHNVSVSGTDVGTYYLTFGPDAIDYVSDGWTVEFELNTGALVIDPAPLTVETGGARKPYNPENPTPLTCVDAAIQGLVNNETATITATGSQTEIGVSDNTYEITWGTAKETNYVIEAEKIGELEVFDASVTVDVFADAVKLYYNGEEQESELWFVFSTKSDSFDLNTIRYIGSEDLTLTTEKDMVVLKTTLKGREVGDYTVKLSADDLICTDENFVVTFNIHGDLTLRIQPIPVTVYVAVNREEHIYTGEEITIPTLLFAEIEQEFGAEYTEDKYVFTGPETIKGTKIGYYTETIVPEMFENKDSNYEVEFVIEKDPTATLYIGQPIVGIELTANVFETIYNGSEHTLTILKDGSVELDGVKQDAPAFTVTRAETRDGEPFDVDLSKITIRKATSVSGTEAGLYDTRDFANYLQYADNTYRVEFVIVGYVTLDVRPIEARLVIDNVETYYSVDNSASYTAHYEGLPAGDEGPEYTLISAEPDAEVGEYPITVEGAKDENVFYDDNHIITFVPGKLTVKPLPITYTAAFANVKVAYTGETQRAGGVDCSVSTDIEGSDVSLFDIESITNYADLESIAYIDVKDINTYPITVDDASKYEGTDSNFDVTMVFVDGSVEVTDELINLGRLELIDAEYTYDGEFHAVEYRLENPDNYTIVGLPITYSGAQADGMEVCETSTDGMKNAGTYGASPGDPRDADIKILDKNGVDVSGICQFSAVVNATLVIKPMPVTVKIWGNWTQKNNYRSSGASATVTGSGYTAEVIDANGNPTDLYVADHLSDEYMLYNGGTVDPQVSGRGINQTYYYNMKSYMFTNQNANFSVTFQIVRDGRLKIVNRTTISYISWKMDNLTVDYNGQDQTFVPSLIDAFGEPVSPKAGDTEVFRATDGQLYYVTFATTPNYEPLTKSAPGTYYGKISNIHFSKIENADGYIVNAADMSIYDVTLNCTATSVQSYKSNTSYGGVFTINSIRLKIRINDDIHKEYAEPDPDRSTWITILEGQLKPGDKIEDILSISREPGENVGKYAIRVSLKSSGWGGWSGWEDERKEARDYREVSIKRVPEEEVNPWQPGNNTVSGYELEIEDVNTTKYLEITPIPLYITANDDSKEYADPHNPDPTFTARVEGLIGSEYLPENFYSIWRDPGEEIGDYPIRLARDEDYVDIIPVDPEIPIDDEPIIIGPVEPPIEVVKGHEDVAMKSATSVVYGGSEDEVERPDNPGIIIPVPIERPYVSHGGGSGYFWSGNYEIHLINGNFNIYGDQLGDPDTPPTPPDNPDTPPTPPDNPDTPPTPPDNPDTPPTTPDNPNPPTESSVETTPPVTEVIIDEAPPTAGLGNRAWALLNLLCTIATVITGILMLVTYFRNKDEDEEQAEDEAVPYATAQVQDEDEEEEKKRKKSKFLGLIPAIGAVIAFILTEDMRLPMIFIDRWTPLMIVILVVGLILAWVTRNKDEEDEDEDKDPQINSSMADPAAAQ